uniref:Uncharacterized protein n=1 Tax=Ditylenchus dipsaci TaxID=166011 RepID=A0A915EHC7_9BILA
MQRRCEDGWGSCPLKTFAIGRSKTTMEIHKGTEKFEECDYKGKVVYFAYLHPICRRIEDRKHDDWRFLLHVAFEYRRGSSKTLPSTAETKNLNFGGPFESKLFLYFVGDKGGKTTKLRTASPDVSVTSKAHLLCSHVVSFVRFHGYWAIISEQSEETLHRKVNEDERRFASVGDGRRS